MSHHQRELSDHDWTHKAITPSTIINLDAKSTKNINGDDGGLWTSAAPIIINGKLRLLGPTVMLGSGAGITTAPGKHIEHGRLDTDDYLTLGSTHGARTRFLTAECAEFAADHATVTQDAVNGAVCAASRRAAGRFFCPLRVHNGARLESVDLAWVVRFAHASLPVVRPRLRIVRVNRAGIVEPLRIAADTSAAGFLAIGSIASVAAYNASQLPQIATYAVNVPDRAVIDTSRFVYFGEIIDETANPGATSPVAVNQANRYFALVARCTDIAHMGPQ